MIFKKESVVLHFESCFSCVGWVGMLILLSRMHKNLEWVMLWSENSEYRRLSDIYWIHIKLCMCEWKLCIKWNDHTENHYIYCTKPRPTQCFLTPRPWWFRYMLWISAWAFDSLAERGSWRLPVCLVCVVRSLDYQMTGWEAIVIQDKVGVRDKAR